MRTGVGRVGDELLVGLVQDEVRSRGGLRRRRTSKVRYVPVGLFGFETMTARVPSVTAESRAFWSDLMVLREGDFRGL